MNTIVSKFRKTEFELRIFISLFLVGMLFFLSFIIFRESENNMVLIGRLFGWSDKIAIRSGYSFIAFLMVVATLLRMWAGSHLSSDRIMAFKVQHDVLTTTGPFTWVRNPVYLADMIAFTGISLCLRPVGLLLPVLIRIHYQQLISWEEESLQKQFGKKFTDYMNSTPKLFPDLRNLFKNRDQFRNFRISYDGFRHNALYFLLIPGFILAAITGSFMYVVVIGIPGVIDWAIIHTIKGLSGNQPARAKEKKKLARSKVFSDILYAQCWEDPRIDMEAFQISSEDVIFSITSGGCNVLAFLTEDPQKIISLDLSPSQNYLLNLKMAAFKGLEYDELMEFLGVVPSVKREHYYLLLRHFINDESRIYWDQNQEKIIAGIIHCGRFEGYMHLLKKWFIRLMGKSIILNLLEAETLEERENLYEKKWKNFRWRLFTRLFLSRPLMSLLFDKAFFEQLEESFSFGKHFEEIIHRGVTRFPLRENNFMSYILFETYDLRYLPVYLKRENFEKIRGRLDRIEIITGDCLDYFSRLPDNSITKFNFTNIFEWMPVETFERILKETIRIAAHNSIMTYRNLLVPRSRPEVLSAWIIPKEQLARELYDKDLSFMYRKYVVEQILKK